jgi:hypothetical protein
MVFGMCDVVMLFLLSLYVFEVSGIRLETIQGFNRKEKSFNKRKKRNKNLNLNFIKALSLPIAL